MPLITLLTVCSTSVTTFRVNIIQHTFNVTTQNTSYHNLLFMQRVYVHLYQLRQENLWFKTQIFYSVDRIITDVLNARI